jgi:hypothetical protein
MSHIPTHAAYLGGDWSQIMADHPSWGAAQVSAYWNALNPQLFESGVDPSFAPTTPTPTSTPKPPPKPPTNGSFNDYANATQAAVKAKQYLDMQQLAPLLTQSADTQGAPSIPAMPGYLKYGFDPEYIQSPAQQFRSFATGFRPGWQRNVFYGQEPQLTQRYLLGLPGTPQSFQDYLGGYDPEAQLGRADLRTRAGQVADIQGLSQADWLSYLAGGEGAPTIGTAAGLTPSEQITYRDIYEPGGQNVSDLARTLALQRGEGEGQYQGVLGQAISNVMTDLFTQYTGENPGGNFLEWYLDRSGGDVSGRLAF